MDLFKGIYAIVPFIIFYWLLDWEAMYYRKHRAYLRYRSFKARLPVYLRMAGMAMLAILVALPFIALVVLT